MLKSIESIQKYILLTLLTFLSVFVLFNNSSPFVVSKLVLLFIGISLAILLWVAKMLLSAQLTIKLGKFDLGIFTLLIAFVLSTFFQTPNKMEAYLTPGTTSFIIAGALIYFLINQFDSKVKYGAKIALYISGILLSVGSLLSALNIFSKIPQLPEPMKDPNFNLLGGAIPSVIFLIAVLIFSIPLILNEKDTAKKALYGFGMGVMLFALTVLTITILPGRATSPRFLTTGDSWEVAIETLKKSPLLGAGPANYLTAFNLYRPLAYNASDLWQVRFTTASNFYLTLITETGFAGLFALSILLIAIYKYVKKDLKLSADIEQTASALYKFAIIILLVLFALLPVTPLLIVYLFILMALSSESEHKSFHLNIAAADTSSVVSSRIPVIIVGTPIIAAILVLYFFGIKIIRAESVFAKSVNALTKNDARTTFDLMGQAIRQNPKVDRYHASFAQVNMALASSIADKKDISDNDRAAITQLVQQAIAEGKATVSLNPTRSGNWEVLAQIYRSIMPFAQGADQFAIQTYTQAIALDPTNANLRISLGGVYYSLGNFDAAIESFRLAALAKPDLANAHYNLAIAHREKKDFDSAIAEMNNVIKLVNPSSQDYSVAKQTLDDLNSKKKAANPPAGSGENLTPPPSNTESNVNPPITLPEEATPPASPNQ